MLTAFRKHPVGYPSLVCIIQRGSCCVQAVQQSSGPCKKDISIVTYSGNMIPGNLCVHIPTYQRVHYCILCLCSCCIIETYSLPTIDCAAVNLFTTMPIYLYFLEFFSPPVVMEKQLEELKQQLEKQCLINQELQRQNKDLGECNRNYITLKGNFTLDHTQHHS